MLQTYIYDLGTVGIGLLLIAGILALGAFVFSLVTKYKDLEEIMRGNVAAAVHMGSKLFGLCVILAFVSYSSHDWLAMATWSVIGIFLLSLVYVIFDFVTLKMKVCEEIQKGNVAVAMLFAFVVIGVSLVIGTFLL